MKKRELRQLIREQVKKVLREQDKKYKDNPPKGGFTKKGIYKIMNRNIKNHLYGFTYFYVKGKRYHNDNMDGADNTSLIAIETKIGKKRRINYKDIEYSTNVGPEIYGPEDFPAGYKFRSKV